MAPPVVVITGGASGIGKAAVEAFATLGYAVVFSDIGDVEGRAVEAAQRAAGHDVKFVQSDATDEASVAALVEGAVRAHGRLDAALNNVGGVMAPDRSYSFLHEDSLEAFEATMKLTLRSVFLGMKHQLRAMLPQGRGSIVNMASLAGLHISPNSSTAYHAAKAGVVHITRKAAVAYAERGVRINAVAPGATATEYVVSAFTEEQRLRMVEGSIPMRRMLTPQEMAASIVWLASDASSGVTGHIMAVDGGAAAR